jgi:lipoate-protein ligase A
MAVDDAILESVCRHESLPTLRLYAWEPACLSLGYTQNLADVDRPRLESAGWHIVRRPTGGRAILHTDELTYSVIGTLAEPRLSGSVLESYRRLSSALVQALLLLGIPAETSPEILNPSGADPHGPVCFEVPSNYELTVGGRKIIGSAQARRKEGVLQHGSLPLWGDLGRITQVLVFPGEDQRREAAARLHARAATVEEVLGAPLVWEAAAQGFQQAFCDSLNLELQIGELSPAEAQLAKDLVESKYANFSWTGRL